MPTFRNQEKPIEINNPPGWLPGEVLEWRHHFSTHQPSEWISNADARLRFIALFGKGALDHAVLHGQVPENIYAAWVGPLPEGVKQPWSDEPATPAPVPTDPFGRAFPGAGLTEYEIAVLTLLQQIKAKLGA